VSSDGGATWVPTRLGHDHGKYSFRQWETHLVPKASPMELKIKGDEHCGGRAAGYRKLEHVGLHAQRCRIHHAAGFLRSGT
jgi:hypothetical protein